MRTISRRVAHPSIFLILHNHKCRVPHPFAHFAKGWESPSFAPTHHTLKKQASAPEQREQVALSPGGLLVGLGDQTKHRNTFTG